MSATTTTATPETRQGLRLAPRRREGRFRRGRVVRYVLLLLFLLLVLTPVYVLLVTSFKGPGDASPDTAWSLPSTWTVQNWTAAWEALAPAIGRTFLMVVPAAVISSVLGAMNGFVLSRWRFPYANLVFTLILFGMFIPYQAVVIPLAQLLTVTLQVPSGIPSLIILHVVYGIPITTLIFRNYYESIPGELIESARVDGAGMLRTFASVILPVSGPGFVVVLIWQFTNAWNDFLFAVFFASSQNGPVTLALNNFANGALLQDYGQSMAGALLASAPTLVVYVVLGRFFIGGLMSGSVKG